LLGCAVTTGFGVVENNAQLRIGESIVVLGVGGVGLNVVQAASLVSAYPVIAVDLFDNRLDLARQVGATHLINSSNTDLQQEIRAILGALGADVVVDTTGLPEMVQLGLASTKPQGRVVMVGVPVAGSQVGLFSLPLHFGKKLSGSHGGDVDPSVDIPRYHDHYRSGRMELRSLITDTFPIEEINEAIAAMRFGEANGRCLISFDE